VYTLRGSLKEGVFQVKKLLSSIRTILFIVAMLVCVLAPPCVAQELSSAPRPTQTPEQIAKWFSSEFKYQAKNPDMPQTPEETLKLRTGDCDDFAFLAAAILAENGVKSKVIIIKYRGSDMMHAICIYRDDNGTYDFISNQELKHTGEHDLTRAVAKFYPAQKSIIVADGKRDYMYTGVAVNQTSVVKATRLIEENGMIRVVRDRLSLE
jgi:hypothetical protein